MFEFLGELFFELVFQLIIEILNTIAIELGLESFSHALRDGKKANPILAYFGIFFFGIIIGCLSAIILPNRLLQNIPFNGSSIILSPLFTGLIMYYFGIWRKNNGHKTSSFATFWGGALFAFSFASTRWLFINIKF